MTLSLRSLAPLLLAAALGACATTPDPDAPRTMLDTWSERVAVEPHPDEVRLATHDTGLSGNQARALSELFGRWAGAEGGEIVIRSPNGSDDPAGAYRTGVGAQDYLVGQGVPAHLVRLVGYDAAGAADAPVIVGFIRYSVSVPQCGGDWGNLTRSFSNEVPEAFGCAVAANLAAQVANPGDLIQPRPMTPASAQRRQDVMEAYRAGEATSAAAEPNGAGNISTAVN